MDDLHLNDEQLRAVASGPGPKLILAGPGTGKTRVITARVIELVKNEIDPEKILALTFSNRAAEEMRERITGALGPQASLISIGTFHAFCADVLRAKAVDAGLDPFFEIATKADSLVMILQAMSGVDFDVLKLRPQSGAIGDLAAFFSRVKEELITAAEFGDFAAAKAIGGPEDKKAAQLKDVAAAYRAYQEKLAGAGLLDFGDLIISTINLFEKRPNVLRHFQRLYEHILVDEFQDTNFAQGRLLRLLAGDRQNLFVVGDDDQSIYRWRGASLKNFDDFEEDFKPGSVILRVNYRSTPDIVAAGQAVIVANEQRRPKELRSAGVKAGLVSLRFADSIEAEAEDIAEEIFKLRRVAPDQTIAILLKSVKGDAGPYVKALDERGIAYNLGTAGDLFESESVKDLLAWIRLLADPFDDVAATRTITGAPFSLPFIDLARIKRRRENSAVIDALKNADNLTPSAAAKIKAWRATLDKLAKSRHRDDVRAYVREIIDAVGLRRRYIDCQDIFSRRRLAELNNVEAVAASFDRFGDRPTIDGFAGYLDWLTAVRLDQTQIERPHGVTILTLHGAKGLEFDHVFMANLTKSKLPGKRRWQQFDIPESLLKEDLSDVDPKGMHEAEQRRLFYVGATRAKQSLYLSYALNRQEKDDPSPYFSEISAKLSIEPTIVKRTNAKRPAVAGQDPISQRRPFGLVGPHGLGDSENAFLLADEIGRLAGAAAAALENDGAKAQFKAGLERLIHPDFHRAVLAHFDDIGDSPVCAGGPPVGYAELVAALINEEGGLNLTVSELKAYQRCPRQFRFRSIDRIPAASDSSRELGTLLHQVLQQWHMNNKRPKADPRALHLLFSEALNHMPASRRPGAKEIEKIKGALDVYFQDFQAQPEEPEHFEKPFSVTIGPHSIRGRIDRVDRGGEGIDLIDYKSGKVMKDPELKRDLQLPIYYLGAAQIFGENPNRLIYHFVVEKEKRAVSPTADDLAAAEDAVMSIADGILSARFEPMPEYMTCRYCDFTLICPAKGVDHA